MESKELRIGNLVMYDNYNVSVIHGLTDKDYGHGVSIHYGNCCVGCDEDRIEPIPLTEEWLLKFGFIKKINTRFNNTEMYLIGNKYIIAKPWGENLKLFNNYLSKGYLIDVLYVHQLQNLYFALTGNELIA